MAKNYMADIAKMLGVEIEEEFKIKEDDSLICDDNNNSTYKFTKTEFLKKDIDKISGIESWSSSPYTLELLIAGHLSVSKLPWKPEMGEIYFSFVLSNGKWTVGLSWWVGQPYEYALLGKGWMYKTRGAAEAALPEIVKELGMKYNG